MKIVMTVNSAWNIANFRLPVLRALQEDGHEVIVLAPPDEGVSRIEAAGAKFLPLEMDVKGLNPVSDMRLLHSLRQLFRIHAPDVILGYTIKNNIFGSMAAHATNIPFIPNVSGLGTAFLSHGLLRLVAERLYRHAFRRVPLAFFQNSDDLDMFVRRGLIKQAQGRLLPGSGIDLDYFQESAPTKTSPTSTFLMIGRLLRDKGVNEFVEAARLVKKNVPEAKFQLLGAVTSQNRTAIDLAAVHSWVSEGAIEYLGVAEDVRPFIERASCVILPSYREGAPRTLIEAAAMARPIITTDVPGCRSVIDDDVSGFLCEAKNAISLADAVTKFLALDREEQRAMGLAGRQKMVREFDERIIVAEYRNAIAEMRRLS